MVLRRVAYALPAFVAMLAAAAALSAGAAEAETPPLLWHDVARVQISCLAVTQAGVDGRLSGEICERARVIAAADAPAPVAIVPLGDPSVLAPDSLTLLIHVSVRPEGPGRLAALSVRPFRNAGQAPLLFAAAPRAALLAASGSTADALAGDLRTALAETLPWLAVPTGPRPMHR